MKKKLEAELISIAHRVLKLKNKDDVRELHREAHNLYEKLSVLLFVEENYSQLKSEVNLEELEEKLENYNVKEEKILVGQIDDAELEIETQKVVEEIKEEPIASEITIETEDSKKEEIPVVEVSETNSKKQISIDDLISTIQPEPVFEKVSSTNIPEPIVKIIEDKVEESKNSIEEVTEAKEDATIETNIEQKVDEKLINEDIFGQPKEIFFEKIVIEKPVSNLNDKLNKGFNITLNDRIAFEKNLFDGSTEDLNRVLSQIGTLSSYQEAKDFIEEMVKPDYNDWKGKDEFSARFMEFVESKFA